MIATLRMLTFATDLAALIKIMSVTGLDGRDTIREKLEWTRQKTKHLLSTAPPRLGYLCVAAV